MKRRCPYCGAKLKGKEIKSHVYEVHQGWGSRFYCREGCVRCCTDEGAPLELVIGDIERISRELGMTNEEFFRTYGGVLWSNIPGTSSLIPSTGLPFPCGFLKDGRCSIYGVRPLHCRLFPERLYVNPSPQDFEPFYRSGYVCLDEGVFVDEERNVEVGRLMVDDQEELERTARFFRNEEHIYGLTPVQQERIHVLIADIASGDAERNRKKREIVEGMIPPDVKAAVREAFLSMLRGLDVVKD